MLRKLLIVIQLATSIFVIIGTLIILDQVSYIKNKDLGFNKENVMVAHVKDTALRNKILPIKNELHNLPGVLKSASVYALPDKELNHTIAFVDNNEGGYDQQGVQFLPADPDLFQVLNMEVVDGRNFIMNSESDLNNSILVNEAAATKYDWYPDPVGKKIHFGPDRAGEIQYFNVIGVVKDFHMGSLQFSLEPIIIYHENLQQSGGEWLMVKVQSANMMETVDGIKGTLASYDPSVPINYSFLDESFQALYQKEQNLVQMMSYLSLIIIAISCMGLLGLISFTVIQRAKEVAIRKVLG